MCLSDFHLEVASYWCSKGTVLVPQKQNWNILWRSLVANGAKICLFDCLMGSFLRTKGRGFITEFTASSQNPNSSAPLGEQRRLWHALFWVAWWGIIGLLSTFVAKWPRSALESLECVHIRCRARNTVDYIYWLLRWHVMIVNNKSKKICLSATRSTSHRG